MITRTKSCGIYELTRDGQWFHGSAHLQTVTRDKTVNSELTGHLIFEYDTECQNDFSSSLQVSHYHITYPSHPMSYLLYLKPT